MKYSVLLLITHSIAREGLSRILRSEGFDVVAALSSADDMCEDEIPEVELAIVDAPTSDEQIGSIAAIRNALDCKTIVLAEEFQMSAMLECFSQGAHGYLLKSMPWTTLIASLRLAALGHKIMPSELSERLTYDMVRHHEHPSTPSIIADANLSQREQDVLQCLIIGDANKIIARKLNLSEATVKIHVKSILRKLNVLNRTQAAILAKSRGVSHVNQQFAA